MGAITFQLDVFPALDAKLKTLRPDTVPTLTELATAGIYGAALRPADFARRRQSLIESSRRVWAGWPNGPQDVLEHLKAILAAEEIPDHPEAHYGRNQRDRVRQWLQEDRLRPAMTTLHPRYAKHKERLMQLSNSEVLEYALVEAEELEKVEAAVAKQASRFYSILSAAAVAGEVVLTGKMQYAYRDAFFERPKLPCDRLDLKEQHLCDRLAHNIDENSLEVNPPYETEADKLFGDIFTSDRFERARREAKIVWSDVRISLKHSQLILRRFAAAEAGRAVTEADDVDSSVSSEASRAEDVTRQEDGAAFGRKAAKRGRPPGAGACDDGEAVIEMIRLLHGELRDDEKRPSGLAPAARAVRHLADGYDRNSGDAVDRRVIRKYKVAMGIYVI